jgi:GNAT superfamily N-acetyltransferase
MTDATVQPLGGGQLAAGAALLARAFQDDPLRVWIVPDTDRRRRVMPRLEATILRYAHRYGEVMTTPDLAGVACWLPPGHSTTLPRLARTGGLGLPLVLGPGALRRALTADAVLQRLHHDLAPEDHWYLSLIGVEPRRQRQGVARRLTAPMLARADAEGLPCYLDTQNPANLPVYERLGFAVHAETVFGDVTVWAMRREPAAHG